MLRPARPVTGVSVAAVVAAAGAVGLIVVALVLTVEARTGTALANLLIGTAVAGPAALLGVEVSRRVGGRRVGFLLTLLGLAVAAVVARETWIQVIATSPNRDDWAWLVAILAEGAWWVLVAVAVLLLHFPDGELPGPRWRFVPPVLVACAALTQAYGAVDPAAYRAPLQDLPHPFAVPPTWLTVLSVPAFVLLLGLGLASALSLVGRFRRSDEHQRAQIKWLALAGLGVPLYPLLCLLEILVLGHPYWFSAAVGITGLVGIPVATAVAMLRHDLYDVDKALAGTVTWAVLTTVLVLVYLAVSLTVGSMVGRGSGIAAAAGAAVAAFALLPLRTRVQAAVDARLYPLRRSVFAALDALHADVSAARARPETVEAVLRAGLRDPGLRVGFRMPGAEGYVDTALDPLSGEGAVRVELDGSVIGVILPSSGLASVELLREVADRCTTLVEVIRLRLELSGALEEVEASRARLVQIGYDERRRLERDLHDGAQQRLVSLGMAIRLAQRHLTDGTVDVDGLLDESVAELGIAVAELRQIAHGLRPSSLDDGLPAALARLVRSVPVTVDMDVHSGPLPDDVATTAYFVVSEAVTNAVKHAEATRITLCVARAEGHVVVRISDNGCGGARLSQQSGLADRVAAMGGSLRVASPRGSGTTVEAALPCAS